MKIYKKNNNKKKSYFCPLNDQDNIKCHMYSHEKGSFLFSSISLGLYRFRSTICSYSSPAFVFLLAANQFIKTETIICYWKNYIFLLLYIFSFWDWLFVLWNFGFCHVFLIFFCNFDHFLLDYCDTLHVLLLRKKLYSNKAKIVE